jgi:hypothetical protein
MPFGRDGLRPINPNLKPSTAGFSFLPAKIPEKPPQIRKTLLIVGFFGGIIKE